MGAARTLAGLVLHPRLGDRRRVHLREPRARGRPVLFDQDHADPGAVARRLDRGHAQPGDRADRAEARGAREPRLHEKHDHAGPDHGVREPEEQHRRGRRARHLGAGAKYDQRHPKPVPGGRRRSRLQRPLWRRLRQHLRFHRRRTDPAPAPRLCRGSARQGADRAERRPGRADRRPRRGDLPGVFHPPARGARHRPAGRDRDAQGAERNLAVRRHAGGAGAHQPARRRPVQLRGKPAGHQPARQRPLLPPQRRRDHLPRLYRPAEGAVPLQGRAGDRAGHRHEGRGQSARVRRGAGRRDGPDHRRAAGRRRGVSRLRPARGGRGGGRPLHSGAVRGGRHRARGQLHQPWPARRAGGVAEQFRWCWR